MPITDKKTNDYGTYTKLAGRGYIPAPVPVPIHIHSGNTVMKSKKSTIIPLAPFSPL
jgi:hypothetical protein